jgi:hypothetical protein
MELIPTFPCIITYSHTHIHRQYEEVSTVIVKQINPKILTDLHVFSTSEYENVVFEMSFVLCPV